MGAKKRMTEEELARQNELALADPSLNITAENVIFCRAMAAQYEAKAKEHEAKAASCPRRSRGAYMSHRTQALKARSAMLANADFQLEWLRRHRPATYAAIKEVTNE